VQDGLTITIDSFYFLWMQLINDEDGGMHKRYASPALRDRGGPMPHSRTSHTSSGSNVIPGYGTSTIVAMDKSASAISSEPSLSSSSLLSQSKLNKTTERSLESVLSSSKQKVSAIESLLKGASDRNFSVVRSSSLDLGIFFQNHQLLAILVTRCIAC
jgi:CLIP-associating protein 1/2